MDVKNRIQFYRFLPTSQLTLQLQTVIEILLFPGVKARINFNSYKLYRHTTSGIVASIGTLITVIKSASGTTFIDCYFNNSTNYFYRIYIVTSCGNSPGSNIQKITCHSKTLVLNGGFESVIGSIVNDWDLIPNTLNEPTNSIQLETTNPRLGKNCLKLNHAIASG